MRTFEISVERRVIPLARLEQRVRRRGGSDGEHPSSPTEGRGSKKQHSGGSHHGAALSQTALADTRIHASVSTEILNARGAVF